MKNVSWVFALLLLLVLCGGAFADTSLFDDMSKEHMYAHAEELYQRYQAGQELMPHEMQLLHDTGFILHIGNQPDELDEYMGPDGFGYYAYNMEEEEGWAFNWIDLENNGGTLIDGYTSLDDGYAGPFDFPDNFSFPFYGEGKTSFSFGSNGSIYFSTPYTSTGHYAIPSAGSPDDYIAFWQRDMHMGYTGGTRASAAYYDVVEIDGMSALVVEVQHISEYGSSGSDARSVDAELILLENGNIVVQYQDIGTTMSTSVTLGIENSDGTMGTQWFYNGTGDLPVTGEEYTVLYVAPQPDANVFGFVMDAETGNPVSGAVVRLGGFTAVTGDGGAYAMMGIYSNIYNATVSAENYVSYAEDGIVVSAGNNYASFDLYAMPPLGYSEDFESDPGDWTLDPNGTMFDWEWGVPTSYMGPTEAHSGNNVWATDLDAGFSYGYDSFTMMTSTRTFEITDPNALMTFWAWDDHYYYSYYDRYYGGFQVRASTDGVNWTMVPINPPYNNNNSYTNYEDTRASNNGPWTEYVANLSAYYGQNIYIQFRHIYDYYYSSYATSYFGTAIDDICIYGTPPPGTIEGTVYAEDGGTNTNCQVSLYEADGVDVLASYITGDDGYYTFTGLQPGMYDVVFEPAYGYNDDSVEDVDVESGVVTTVDVTLTLINIWGAVYGVVEDVDGGAIAGVTITEMLTGMTAVTDEDGEFFFGDDIGDDDFRIGPYTFHVDGVFEGDVLFHDDYFYESVVEGDNEFTFTLEEIMAPQDLTTNWTTDSPDVTLYWTDPANHVVPELLQILDDQIAEHRANIAMLENSNEATAPAKLAQEQEALDILIRNAARLERRLAVGDELDSIDDFMGTVIEVNGMLANTIVPAGTNEFTVSGLAWGQESTFRVAADYGYGVYVWSEEATTRPLPSTESGYVMDAAEYDWIEINPANDGLGSIALESGDDSNSGEVSFSPLEFEYYGVTYSSFGACSNGWFSFTNFTSNTIGVTLPSTSEPNATLVPCNGDYHAGVAGDDCGIWYYVDEDNEQVIIQYRLRPYGGNTDYRFDYEIVLDCENNTILFNFQAADDWIYYFRANALGGIENTDGTEALIFDMNDLVNEMSLLFYQQPPIGQWAALTGTLTDMITGEPVADAEVVASSPELDDSFMGTSNGDGFYRILVDFDLGDYDLVVNAEGYLTAYADSVTWDEEEFEAVTDIEMEPLGSMTGIITDMNSGDPIANAVVMISNNDLDDTWMTYTDEDGYYMFERMFGRDAGPYAMAVMADGYLEGNHYNMNFGEEQYIMEQDMGLEPGGTIWGLVSYAPGQFVSGAVVVVTCVDDGESYTTMTNEVGYYEFTNMFDRALTFDVDVMATGYLPGSNDGVTFAEDQYVVQADVVLGMIDDSTPPNVGSTFNAHDTGFDLVTTPPGIYMDELVTMQYDDGVNMGSITWLNGAPSEDMMFAVPFYPECEGVLVQADIRNNAEGDWAWDYPNYPNLAGEYWDIVIRVFADDGGLPGALLYESDPTVNSADDPWNHANPMITVPADGFWVAYYTYDSEYFEPLYVDGVNNYYALAYTTNGGESWTGSSSGDPLIRATMVTSGGEMVTLGMPESQVEEPVHGMGVQTGQLRASFELGEFIDGAYTQPHLTSTAYAGIANELDEFYGFNIYYSTDGETFVSAFEEPTTIWVNFIDVGSEFEGMDVDYYATSVSDDGVESDPSETYTTMFGVAPSPVPDLEGSIDGNTITLNWTAPTTNEDGSELTDLAGYVVYRNGVVLDEVAADVVTYNDELGEDVSGILIYWVTAVDEVPLESGVAITLSTGLLGTPSFATSFEEGDLDPFNMPAWQDSTIWEVGAPTAGPLAAYTGDNVYATGLATDYLYDSYADAMVTDPFAIFSPTAALSYYHWVEYEAAGDPWDGYNVMVSPDFGETWEIIEPIGGYPVDSLHSLTAFVEPFDVKKPGFSEEPETWEQVIFFLGDYYNEDEVTYLQFRIQHAADEVTHEYFGVAIDDLELYGTPPEAVGDIEGTVTDVNEEAVQGVMVYFENDPMTFTYTNAEGEYSFSDIDANFAYTLWYEHDNFWPTSVEDVQPVEDDVITVDAIMYDPEGAVSEDAIEIRVDLHSGWEGAGEFSLESVGGGTLEWDSYVTQDEEGQVYSGKGRDWSFGERGVLAGPQTRRNGRMMRKVNGDVDAISNPFPRGPIAIGNELDELWDWLDSYSVTEATDNYGIFSAVFTEAGLVVNATYIDPVRGDNMLYMFDHDGNLEEAYPYPEEMVGSDGRGFYDITYDPASNMFLGGNGDGEIFVFSCDFSSYENMGNIGFRPTAVAYDYDNDNIFFRNWDTFFVMVDLTTDSLFDLTTDSLWQTGQAVGMAYMSMDDSGYNIWTLSRNEDNQGGYMYRYNPETNIFDMEPVMVYDPEEGKAGGMSISDGYDSGSMDITTVLIAAEGSQVDIWEGYAKPIPWLVLDPSEGVLEPEEEVNIGVSFFIPEDEREGYGVGDEFVFHAFFHGPYWDDAPSVDINVELYNSIEETEQLPVEYALHQNYPNPFNPTTNIRFALVEAQDVKLAVYNVLGQEVMHLVNNRMEAGYHTVSFDARAMASGVYFYRIEAGPFTSMKKMVLVK